MTQHILCSIDMIHIDETRSLLIEAEGLAGFYGAALSVATVLPDYNSSWVGSFFKNGTLKEAANDALHKLVREALRDREQVQHIVKIGVVYEQVLEAIGECVWLCCTNQFGSGLPLTPDGFSLGSGLITRI